MAPTQSRYRRACHGATSDVAEPAPVGSAEKEREQIRKDSDCDAGADKVTWLEGPGTVGYHTLGRVHRQDEAKAHDELQYQNHAEYVDARRLHFLENRNHDRD